MSTAPDLIEPLNKSEMWRLIQRSGSRLWVSPFVFLHITPGFLQKQSFNISSVTSQFIQLRHSSD